MKIYYFLILVILTIFSIELNYSYSASSNDTIITVQMNGPSTFYLDSPNIIIRAWVEIQNYNPSDGYYFMKVTHLPTQLVLKDFEIQPKDFANDLWGVQIAYPVLESKIATGEYEIQIRTEFGSQTGSTKFIILESSPEESSPEESLPETTKSTSSPSPNPTTTTPSSKSVTKSTELISADSIYRKISNIIGNTDYSLGGKTTQRANDVTKTSYEIFDPDGETIGIVNFFSVDNNIKQLEISTSHFNDDESKVLAGIVLMGLVKAVMDPQEYDTDLFTKMLGEAIIEEDSTRLIPGGHTVTVSSIEVVKGTPGLTFFIFTVDYHQSAYISNKIDSEKSPTSSNSNKLSERLCPENKICAFPGEYLKYQNSDTWDDFSEIAIVEFKEKINDNSIKVFIDGWGSKPLTYNLNLKTGIETHSQYPNVNRPFNLLEPIPMKIGQQVNQYLEGYYESTIEVEQIVNLKEFGLSDLERSLMLAKTDLGNGDSVILAYDKETGVLISNVERYQLDGKQYTAGMVLTDTNIFSAPTKITKKETQTSSPNMPVSAKEETTSNPEKKIEKVTINEESEDNEITAGDVAGGMVILFGIPAIIIGLIIWKIKRGRAKKQEIRDTSWKGV